ncbi:MAG: Trk system potassium transporter TrkA [Actinomycetota bacterium]|nr:Trk system potassium transporter TrkA [Actinomycetota bacterium]
MRKIIIVGAGEVGSFLAQKLSTEQHEVTVIEENPKKVENLSSELDVLVILGNGASPSSLSKAGASSADLIIAVTEKENVNMLACYVAKNLGTKKSFARVQDESMKSEQGELKIDQIIDPSESACDEIEKLLSRTGIYDIYEFGEGKLLSIGGVVSENSPIIGKPLHSIHEKDARGHWLITAYVRDGKSSIANGNTIVNKDDHIKIIVKSGEVATATSLLGISGRKEIDKAIIIGASRSSELLAERLVSNKYDVIVLDDNESDCTRIAENLSQVIVICADPKDPKNIIDAGVNDSTALIALSKDDSKNIVCSLIAKSLGVPEIITRVNKIDYMDLLKETSIQATISTRIAAANEILKDVRSENVTSALTFEDSEVEALEIQLSESCSVLGEELKDIILPSSSLIAGVIRRGDVHIPTGEWQFAAKDKLVVFSLPKSISEIEKIFC